MYVRQLGLNFALPPSNLIHALKPLLYQTSLSLYSMFIVSVGLTPFSLSFSVSELATLQSPKALNFIFTFYCLVLKVIFIKYLMLMWSLPVTFPCFHCSIFFLCFLTQTSGIEEIHNWVQFTPSKLSLKQKRQLYIRAFV